MKIQESRIWIHKTAQVCHMLGLNKNRPAEFKLAYDIAVLMELAK